MERREEFARAVGYISMSGKKKIGDRISQSWMKMAFGA
jgi:hypothetical protein